MSAFHTHVSIKCGSVLKTMTGARFRSCELEGIGGVTSWEGAVVHPDDLLGLAYVLAGALGIRVNAADD